MTCMTEIVERCKKRVCGMSRMLMGHRPGKADAFLMLWHGLASYHVSCKCMHDDVICMLMTHKISRGHIGYVCYGHYKVRMDTVPQVTE